MNDKSGMLRGIRTAVALILVVMYLAGLIAMLTSRVQLALILWVISTLGGIGMLYWLHTRKKRAEALDGSSGKSANGDQ